MYKELNIINLFLIISILCVSFSYIPIDNNYLYVYYIIDIILSNRLMLIIDDNQYIKSLYLIFILTIFENIYFIFNITIYLTDNIILFLYILRYILIILIIILKSNYKYYIYNLSNIRHNNYIIDTSLECPVCYEIITDNLTITFCNHIYHKECIYKWLILNDSCPICRKIIKKIIFIE